VRDRLVDRVGAAFVAAYGAGDSYRIACAPGRVNLIGEHTDYNDGFVLPIAIDRFVAIAFRPRADGCIDAVAPQFRERHALAIGALRPGEPRGWMSYVAGVIWALRQAGMQLRGMDIAVLGDVPIGAGLSSSAALEMAVARAACAASELPWQPERMALRAQQAEREYVGVSCGIMDQFASAMSVQGCALLLDCRSLETHLVQIPATVVVVVMDTGVRRTLAHTAYNERYHQCQQAVRAIQATHPGVRALRDVTPEILAAVAPSLDGVVARRTRHVVEENQRPAALAEALGAGRLQRAGELLRDSHRSLRDLYEVSAPELDCVVELASRQPGCYGARLTGAGFGGCAIALVDRARLDGFIDQVRTSYRAHFDHPAELFPCHPASGALILD
jgi:galactokinase